MPLSMLPSFLVYCFVAMITPGPANLASLSAALRYGRGPALRQWRGLFCGFFAVSMGSVLVTWLLGAALERYVRLLTWVGAAYIRWMAWHTLRSSGQGAERDAARPTFRTGFLLQLANVKVLVFCLTTLSAYVLPYSRSLPALLAVGLFLPVAGPGCNLVWLFAGASMQKLFADHRRAVDVTMAALLALCAVNLLLPH
ncbi:MAG: LysE family transporter [Oscillospiraceae bacterium]|nr:LysE family transporter [Oscillospiraceae bacterium]